MSISVKPLVTAIQLSYNNERHIAEALESTFAQTYSPLQIIICDDCSRDGSFEIIEKMAARYDGPHRIMLHRNEKNLGLGNNVSRVMNFTDGDLIVEFDGDDISYPYRVEEVVGMWAESKGAYKVICGESLIIDEAGKPSEPLPKLKPITFDKVLHSKGGQWVHGGSLAWHRSLFDIFGSLHDGVVAQDKAIGFRSLLLGQPIGYIDRPVIKYRVHSSNLTNDRTTQERLDDKVAMLAGFVEDFDRARSLGLLQDGVKNDEVYEDLVKAHTDFSFRQQVLCSGFLRSMTTLMFQGNFPIRYRKSLFMKRLLGDRS